MSSIDELAGAETEEDAEPIDALGLRSAFVSGSDWTISTLLDQLRRGNIDLNPRFQRREVWREARKSRLIESILLNFPIPQIVLAESPSNRSRFIVIDGKQRLLTLRQFCADPLEHPEDSAFTRLRLRGLKLRGDLNTKSYHDLKATPGLADDRDAFDNCTIRTVVIRNWPSPDYLFRIFLRLNAETVALSPQELRQALEPGPFVDFIDERAVNSDALRTALGQAGPDFRMRDTELLLRAVAFALRADAYAGNLKAFLDTTCSTLNKSWESRAEVVAAAVDRIEEATSAALAIFGPRVAFSRYTAGEPERRFNRAIFDVIVHSLSQRDVRMAALRSPQSVVDTLKELCDSDHRFVDAITSTTKSLPNTAYRFSRWANALAASLGVDVAIPATYLERAAQALG